MENKNNKQPPGKGIMAFTWILIAVITAVIAANDGDTSILSVAIVIVTVVLVILIDRAKTARRTKKTANASRPTVELHRPYPQPKAKQTAAILRHRDEAEEAVTCAHVTGKEKYIQQLDSYLKAGLIDKNEYRIMKERYEQLDLPDDYH